MAILCRKTSQSTNYARSAHLGKRMKIMLLVTNYAKNYVSKIYQSLRPIRKSRVLAVVGVKENVSASRAFFRS